MMPTTLIILLVLAIALSASVSVDAFTAPRTFHSSKVTLRMSEPVESPVDPMAEAELDSETLLMMEKARRADELRAQEVFMTKSTGKHKCTNCDWEYDETKGDAMMIGGMIKPGTKFEELPSNWRCPVCRASKDSFQETLIEIPGFAVNQGYGLGTNGMTSGQKTGLVFGGLFFFFLLLLSGYALN
jgi:rubredoxin